MNRKDMTGSKVLSEIMKHSIRARRTSF